jgi:hypothetical protein
MKVYREIEVDFPNGLNSLNSHWTLRIRREGNSPDVEFALYWGDKELPVHWGVHPANKIKAAIDQLFQQGEE